MKTSCTRRTESYALKYEQKRNDDFLQEKEKLEQEIIVLKEQQSQNEELRTENEELRTKTEELRTATEELRTATEELRTANEELRTQNEELRTGKEKLEKEITALKDARQRNEQLMLEKEKLEQEIIALKTAQLRNEELLQEKLEQENTALKDEQKRNEELQLEKEKLEQEHDAKAAQYEKQLSKLRGALQTNNMPAIPATGVEETAAEAPAAEAPAEEASAAEAPVAEAPAEKELAKEELANEIANEADKPVKEIADDAEETAKETVIEATVAAPAEKPAEESKVEAAPEAPVEGPAEAVTEAAPEAEKKQPTVKTGDIITLGSYKGNPIPWIVLEQQDSRLQLLSQYAIEQMEFDKEINNDWEKSSIRSWLNKDFYNQAFDKAAKAIICEESIKNDYTAKDKELVFRKSTQDKVFLLNADTVKAFQGKKSILRFCKPSQQISIPDMGYGDYCEWWLRTPGTYSGWVQNIDGVGYHNYSGMGSGSHKLGIRPAIWIDISKLEDSSLLENLPNFYEQQPLKKLKVQSGDTIKWGTYRGKPIVWRVLSNRSGEPIELLSEFALDARPFHNSYEKVNWSKSSLRKWLNEDFYNKAFTPEEKEQIISNQKDRVTLLSNDDAKSDPFNAKKRQCKLAPDIGGDADGIKAYANWWLKGPEKMRREADFVVNSGGISHNYGKVTDQNVYIRPIIYLKKTEY